MKSPQFNRKLALAFILSALLLTAPSSRATSDAAQLLQKFQELGIDFTMVSQACQFDFIIEKYGEMVELPYDTSSLLMMEYPKPMGEILNEIQKNRGRVVLDCSLFAQIAALILTEKMQDPNPMIFMHGLLRAEIAPLYFGVDFAYVGLHSMDQFMNLQKTTFRSKGQWLIRVDENAYLGLNSSGVKLATREEWVNETKSSLFRQIDQRLVSVDNANASNTCAASLHYQEHEIAEAQLFQLQRQEGHLDKWTIYDFYK